MSTKIIFLLTNLAKFPRRHANFTPNIKQCLMFENDSEKSLKILILIFLKPINHTEFQKTSLACHHNILLCTGNRRKYYLKVTQVLPKLTFKILIGFAFNFFCFLNVFFWYFRHFLKLEEAWSLSSARQCLQWAFTFGKHLYHN